MDTIHELVIVKVIKRYFTRNISFLPRNTLTTGVKNRYRSKSTSREKTEIIIIPNPRAGELEFDAAELGFDAYHTEL